MVHKERRGGGSYYTNAWNFGLLGAPFSGRGEGHQEIVYHGEYNRFI